MSPTLTSQGLVLATAMAVSAGTLVLFDLFRQNLFPPQIPPNPSSHQHQLLKSCLSSGSRNVEKESRRKKKKKRVKFAEDVKDSKGNGEIYRKEGRKSAEIGKKNSCCGNEMQKMPANRAALYNGILRDRVHRIQYSH